MSWHLRYAQRVVLYYRQSVWFVVGVGWSDSFKHLEFLQLHGFRDGTAAGIEPGVLFRGLLNMFGIGGSIGMFVFGIVVIVDVV